MGKIRIVLENEICCRERCEFYEDAIICKDCDSLDKAEKEIREALPKKRKLIQEKLTCKFDALDRNSNYMAAGYNEAIDEINEALFG